MSGKKGSGWLNLLLVGGAFGALVWLEPRRPQPERPPFPIPTEQLLP